jgi:hypothetical protein
MKTIISILMVLSSLVWFSPQALAQGENGKFGFGVSAFDNLVLTGRYWLGNDIALDAGFGFTSEFTDVFVLAGGLIKTIGGAENVYPYLGGRLVIAAVEEAVGEDEISLAGIFGAEFFAVRRFSLIGESRLLINLNDTSGNTSVETRAALTLLFYLN